MNKFLSCIRNERKKFFGRRALLLLLAGILLAALCSLFVSQSMHPLQAGDRINGGTDSERLENSLNHYRLELENGALSEEEREILNYKIEHRIPLISDDAQGSHFLRTSGEGTYLALIFIVIFAAGLVCKEFSDGSVKTLYTSPVRRWKIFASKAVILLFYCVLAAFLLFAFTLLIAVIRYGTGGYDIPQVFYMNGAVRSCNIVLFLFFTTLHRILVFFTAGILTMLIANLLRQEVLTVVAGILIFCAIGWLFGIMRSESFVYFLPMGHFDLLSFLLGTQHVNAKGAWDSVVVLTVYSILAAVANLILISRREIR